ncbi:30S ribosomal protein S5 [Candidatus Woesearchaeota archaeon]|nr:30S ribosomal protein S5 [Candidatus Woesearchaeota archaeon]
MQNNEEFDAETPEEGAIVESEEEQESPETTWTPKTKLGEKVKKGEITDINSILDSGKTINETQIVELLLPDLEKDLLLVGQAKGKFGGGKRRVFKQTQKKTNEGNKPRFTTMAIVGNKNGIIGFGYGKSKETVPAREKAFRNAKLNIFKIRRGCGSWQCMCGEPHSLPFMVEGKSGSVKVRLIPAPKGTGLCIEKECAKVIELAGIKDIWSKTFGQTKTKMNLIKACEHALRQLIKTKIQPDHVKKLSIEEGQITPSEQEKTETEETSEKEGKDKNLKK